MNIFITGASGFIGTDLVQALSDDPTVDNLFALYRQKEQIPFIPKVNPILGDLEGLPDIKTDAEINILVHLAGYFKTESKALCDKVNVQGTKKVIEFCKVNKIPRVLFFSTINVDLKSKGCYAASKLAAEQEIRDSGLEYMILRPSLVFKGRTGSLGKIIRYAEKLPFVPVFGSGKAKEQPIHLNELTALTIAAIKEFKPGLTIYAAGKEALSFRQLVKTIGHSMGKKSRVLPIPAKPVKGMLRLLEKIGIHPGVSSEQVAHMSEDLAADMDETLKLYPVELKAFEDHMKEIAEHKLMK
ncbi:MAG: NAD(P)H-binding protein [Ruminiclostridium sp.]|nr:NAD(P)H-binding protein [Ruminiclostridium sp.]